MAVRYFQPAPKALLSSFVVAFLGSFLILVVSPSQHQFVRRRGVACPYQRTTPIPLTIICSCFLKIPNPGSSTALVGAGFTPALFAYTTLFLFLSRNIH